MAGEPGCPAELLADADRPGGWMLLAGGVPQSYVDLRDPRHLELEYMRRLGHVADLAGPAWAPLRVLHLGGGALTLARYVAATRPGSPQVAVEADAAVARLVARRLPLDPAWRDTISVREGDARDVAERVPAGSFDLVVADVFSGAATPARLASAEFAAAAARSLAPGGVFAANISDGPPLAHTRSRVAATLAVFGPVCLIAEPDVLAGRRFGNLVAVAAARGRELPVPELARRAAADGSPAQVLAGPDAVAFAGGAAPITDHSPVPPASPPPGVFAGGSATRPEPEGD